jgi:hypothetical protein
MLPSLSLLPLYNFAGWVIKNIKLSSDVAVIKIRYAGSYVKSMGLNLKEHSSGKHKGKRRLRSVDPGLCGCIFSWRFYG